MSVWLFGGLRATKGCPDVWSLFRVSKENLRHKILGGCFGVVELVRSGWQLMVPCEKKVSASRPLWWKIGRALWATLLPLNPALSLAERSKLECARAKPNRVDDLSFSLGWRLLGLGA